MRAKASSLLLACLSPRLLPSLVLLHLAAPVAAEGERLLVLTSKALAPALEDYARYRRAQGWELHIECVPEPERPVVAAGPSPTVQKLLREFAPAAVLIVGSTAHVPAMSFRPGDLSGQFETDQFYGRADPKTGLPALQVGRLPVNRPEEFTAIWHKIRRYEGEFVPGESRNTLLFLASPAYFGTAIDTMFESIATSALSETVAAPYHLQVLYAAEESPYGYVPTAYPRYVRELLERGPRWAVYTGHGSRRSFARVRDGSRRYPYFGVADMQGLRCRGQLPIFFSVACLTGDYEDPAEPGLCAALVLEPHGPVAAFGSSQVSQPVPNLLLDLALLEQAVNARPATLGAAIAAVRRDLQTREHRFAWMIESLVRGEDDVAAHKRETQLLYNLFGDPTLRLRHPARDLELRTERRSDGLVLLGRAPGLATGRALVRYEIERKKLIAVPAGLGDLPPDERGATRRANHELANKKSLVVREVPIVEHRFELELPFADVAPARLAGRVQREFWFRVYAWNEKADAVGALPWTPPR